MTTGHDEVYPIANQFLGQRYEPLDSSPCVDVDDQEIVPDRPALACQDLEKDALELGVFPVLGQREIANPLGTAQGSSVRTKTRRNPGKREPHKSIASCEHWAPRNPRCGGEEFTVIPPSHPAHKPACNGAVATWNVRAEYP